MQTVRITTLEELGVVASEVLVSCTKNERARVIALSGDLGAGKTAFVKELAKLLGVEYEITSPTFVVMKSYPITAHDFFETLTHIDAYRIESDDEMRVLGFADMLSDSKRIVCIEWPEKIANLIPKDVITVALTLLPDGAREITYGN